MECRTIKEFGIKFLSANICKRPNGINFGGFILNMKNKITLINVAKFIKCGFHMYMCISLDIFILNHYLLFVRHSVL